MRRQNAVVVQTNRRGLLQFTGRTAVISEGIKIK
jgi:hypothetical protein